MIDKEEFEKEMSICWGIPYHYLKDVGDAFYDYLKLLENNKILPKPKPKPKPKPGYLLIEGSSGKL